MESAPPLPARARLIPRRRWEIAAAFFGLVLPGLGQVYAGRPGKGALVLLAILPTFGLGWFLTGFSIVDPARYGLDFAAQVLLGGPTAVAYHLSRDHVLDHLPRFFDVGRLYVQVAGLLNFVALCDAVGEVIRHNRHVDALRAADARRRAAEAEAEAVRVEAMPPPAPEADGDGRGRPDLGPSPAGPSAPPGEAGPAWWEDGA